MIDRWMEANVQRFDCIRYYQFWMEADRHT
jgi:hypothetical protein